MPGKSAPTKRANRAVRTVGADQIPCPPSLPMPGIAVVLGAGGDGHAVGVLVESDHLDAAPDLGALAPARMAPSAGSTLVCGVIIANW